MRSQQDLIVGPVEGYKIVNADLTCRGFQFEVGKRISLPNTDALELCRNGFHFCQYPSGVWAYYNEGRVFKVRAYGVLVQDVEPGADYKLVCEEIELYEEVSITGDGNTGNRNTGNRNTGNRNTGDWNTGNGNTGNRNTGDWNTGNGNTGNRNTGNGNTGNRNTGDRNTGNRNTGDGNTGNGNTGNRNTGDGNTGDGNTGDYHSGSLNHGEAPIYLFNKKTSVSGSEIPWGLVDRLSRLLLGDNEIDPTEFLSIPNASAKAIKALHAAHIAARKERSTK